MTRVGLICLGEAGNLGDDLILIAAVRSILAVDPKSVVSFLSYGQELDWKALACQLGLSRLPERVRARREFLWIRDNRRLFARRDVIVFGGGGLLQTSHQPELIYDWLSYLPERGHGPPVLAVGHGLGPINDRWIARLQSLGDPFSESWVRDAYSLELSRNRLNWRASRCQDFVSKELIESLAPRASWQGVGPKVLGVAVRAWDGLDVRTVANHVTRVASLHECERVEFFVLETKSGSGRDFDLAREIVKALGPPAPSIRAYDPGRILEFLSAMRDVDVAISMKLHSCALWGACGVPIYPIYYAPKIASFFGRDFVGLQISGEIVGPADSNEAVPSASEVIATRLSRVRWESTRVMDKGFSASERARFQFTRTCRSVARRLSFLGKPTVRLLRALRGCRSGIAGPNHL